MRLALQSILRFISVDEMKHISSTEQQGGNLVTQVARCGCAGQVLCKFLFRHVICKASSLPHTNSVLHTACLIHLRGR